MHKIDKSYETLLNRIQGDLAHASKKDSARLEIPEPQIIWVGQRTIFRNFMEFPKALRREPEKLLLYLNKELASAGYIAGEQGYFPWSQGTFIFWGLNGKIRKGLCNMSCLSKS